ncbi:MAG: hypothetical protein AB1757_23215 [Acidobacteriota bacterium]
MTRTHRIIAISLVAALLLTGFAIGRLTQSSNTSAAETTEPVASNVPATTTPVNEAPAAETAGKERDFYLSDFKVGYTDGFNAGVEGQTGTVAETSREGYNDGYKEGYADGVQTQAKSETPGVRVASAGRERVVYRSVDRPVYRTTYVAPRKRGSKLKTALTIAAPAAIGAGIGAMFAGKKGAGIGALLGGGGGAIYHLRKNRNRD